MNYAFSVLLHTLMYINENTHTHTHNSLCIGLHIHYYIILILILREIIYEALI